MSNETPVDPRPFATKGRLDSSNDSACATARYLEQAPDEPVDRRPTLLNQQVTTPGPFESRWGKVALVLIGATVGGFVGEPIKNWINRARVDVKLVSIQSTTPSKSTWRMSLSTAAQHKLSDPVAGSAWSDAIGAGSLTYGDLQRRQERLQSFHDAYPAIKPATPSSDSPAFYESNREYIRTVLEYIPGLNSANRNDVQRARNFLQQDKRDNVSLMSFLAPSLQGGPPANASDMIALARDYQAQVKENTTGLLTALKEALANERADEPIPSFRVAVDITNYGGASTSIGSIGSLLVQAPNQPAQHVVVALTLQQEAPPVSSVLAPGQRQRFHWSADEKPVVGEKSIDMNSSPEFLQRLKDLQERQINALKVLGPLYKSGVNQCDVKMPWGNDGKGQASGSFGEAQLLNQLEGVLGANK